MDIVFSSRSLHIYKTAALPSNQRKYFELQCCSSARSKVTRLHLRSDKAHAQTDMPRLKISRHPSDLISRAMQLTGSSHGADSSMVFQEKKTPGIGSIGRGDFSRSRTCFALRIEEMTQAPPAI